MPNRVRKKKRSKLDEAEDPNTLAGRIVNQATGQEPPKGKNPWAVMLGKLGASKGGKARAAKLSSRRKKEIARDAAKKRWKGRRQGQ